VETPTQTKIRPEWPPSRRTLSSFDKLETTDERVKFVSERIFPHDIFKNLYGVQPIIMDSIHKHGLDPSTNFFLNFVTSLNVPMTNAKSRPKLQYIYDSYLNKRIDLHMPVLKNPSLYDRSDREFQYTLNAFYMMSDIRRAAVYIKDTSEVDTKEFLIDGTNEATATIKPAGLTSNRNGDTIYNVIEKWTKDNEYSPEEIAKKKQKEEEEKNNKDKKQDGDSKKDAVTATKWTYEYFKGIVEKVFANHGKFTLALSNEEEYLNRLFATFKMTTISPLNRAQQNNPNTVTKDVKSINDTDVKKFGDPNNVDVPINITSDVNGNKVHGVYVFHKFVDTSESSMKSHSDVANKNLKQLKNSIYDISPTTIEDMEKQLQAIITAIESLSPISN
jgi:hypothetical protein